MLQFRNVLVGVPCPTRENDTVSVDPPTQAAVAHAIELAHTNQCRLTFLSVVDPPSAGFLAATEDQERLARQCEHDAACDLDDYIAQLDCEGLNITTRVVSGQPWNEVCQAVLAEQFDLVIAGTRNVGALRRFLFGGTGLRLLRNCPCPVWIVKPREEEEGEMDVLVASQLDDVGQTAINLAVDASEMLNARVHVLHAIDLPSARQLGMNADEREQYRAKLRDEREEELQQQIAQTDYRTVPHGVETHVMEGRPYVCILEAIESESIDLLIMGTAGRGGLPGAIIGNTAEHLLSEIPCSILAIKPPDFECPVKPRAQD